MQRIEEIVLGLTKIMRADYELDFYGVCPAVINDKNIVDMFLKTSRKVLVESSVHILDEYNGVILDYIIHQLLETESYTRLTILNI